ncbi:TonB family protein [Psychrobacter lutiphocae]|uniref:TonB family protein n=1 Tax=Psychrobacter lutiphocae TaxID=540500 RepID=UPI00036E2BBE|nr:TonB family protein [Psychrobacter lutiphocae]
MNTSLNDSLSFNVTNTQKVKLTVLLVVVTMHAALALLLSTIDVPLKQENKKIEPIQIQLLSLAPEVEVETLPPEVIKQTTPQSAKTVKSQSNSTPVVADREPTVVPTPKPEVVPKVEPNTQPKLEPKNEPKVTSKVKPTKTPETKLDNPPKPAETVTPTTPIETSSLPKAVTVDNSSRTTTVISANGSDQDKSHTASKNAGGVESKASQPVATNNTTGSASATSSNAGDTSGSSSNPGESGAVASGPIQISASRANASWVSQPRFELPDRVNTPRNSGKVFSVILKLTVDKQGKITKAELASPSGNRIIDRAALSAVKSGRFRPFKENNVPVVGLVYLPVDYPVP